MNVWFVDWLYFIFLPVRSGMCGVLSWQSHTRRIDTDGRGMAKLFH